MDHCVLLKLKQVSNTTIAVTEVRSSPWIASFFHFLFGKLKLSIPVYYFQRGARKIRLPRQK